jgi:TonB family protein
VSAVAFADIKTRVQIQRGNNPAHETVHFAKGQRLRVETPNAPLVVLTQCDQKKRYLLNPYNKTFMVTDFNDLESEFEQRASESTQPGKCGGTVHVKQQITDLNDLATIDGVTARHLKIVATFTPDPGSCRANTSTSINDGWYADLGQSTGCRVDEGMVGITGPTYAGGDKYVREGDRLEPNLVPLRTVAQQLFTNQAPADALRNAVKHEVTELSLAPLDDSLFDIPAGFREVHTRGELMQMQPAGPPQVASTDAVGGKIYKVGPGITAPRAIYSPEPEYTDAARKANVNGTVVTSLIVGPDGRVRTVSVSRSLRPDLDEQALRAIRTWVFEPARLAGEPVAVQLQVEATFRLY